MSFDADRLRLVNLLTEAAELEHSLACQYLFGAFTLETRPEHGPNWEELELIRRWKAQTLLVARQEMEHLGLVANLLTAIGEAPYFDRPDFPTRRGYYPIHLECSLEPFSLETLRRWIRFEMPATLSSAGQGFVAKALPAVDATAESSIEKMYREIRALLQSLGTTSPSKLFIGPSAAQTTQTQIIPVPLRGIQLPPNSPFYNVLMQPVVDLTTALAVVNQIMVEGEGSPDDRKGSHFAIFRNLHTELEAALKKNRKFCPSREVIPNPRTRYPDDEPRPGTLTVESTNRLSELFDLGYATMMLMLIRFFAHVDETAAELAGLQQVAFFPLMTTFIRPVGEMLTLLPAQQAHPRRTAGPSFVYPRRLEFLPHKHAAYQVMQSQLLALQAMALPLTKEPAFPEEIRTRLVLVYENAGRMAINFANAMGLPVPAP